MTLSVETVIVVSLMMAVFAAVATVGSSLYLGAGYERLRAGFETIKKQTAFFSEAILKLDHRVDSVEKQSGYFFQAISNLEHQSAAPVQSDVRWQPKLAPEKADEKLILVSKDDMLHIDTGNLLSPVSFIPQPAKSLTEQFTSEARPEIRAHFH